MPKRKQMSGEQSSPAVTRKKTKATKQISLPYYQGTPSNGPTPVQQNIKKVFDNYKDNDEPDKISMEGTMKYLTDLQVDLDDAAVMAIFDQLQAPAMGEFERDKFVAGWQAASSTNNPCDSIDRQAQYTNTMRQKLDSDPDYFKQVYKAAFKYAKPDGQRAVPAETAFAYWDMFFRKGKGGTEWNTSDTKWMDLWTEYYNEKNKRPVNKDLWNQFSELVSKTREEGGESLDWWSEDGAWPTAVDDFVAFVRQKRQTSNNMDVS